MVRFLCGDSPKTVKEEVLKSVGSLESQNSEVLIVVPEMFTYASELQVMDFLELESVINIKVISFQRMTEIVLNKEGGIKRQRIDDVGKSLIIRKLMTQNPDYFRVYKGMIDKDGFYSKIIDIIKEFKNNLITPESLEKLGLACKSDLVKEKVQEIVYIYKSLEEELYGKYVDNEDRLNQLLEVLEDSEIYKEKNIFFWQFSSFSQLEYNIIKSIIKMKTNVTFGLLYKEENTLNFEITKKTLNKLKEITIEVNQEFEEDMIENTIFPKYSYMVRNTIEDEINLVARKIRLLLDEGIGFDKIALISLADEYKTQVKRIFEEYGIPVLINNKESLSTTALATWIKGMLKVINYGFKYEDLIAFLKSCLNSFNFHDVQIFENYVLRRNIRGDMYFKEKYFRPENFVSENEEQAVIRVREYIENGFKQIKSFDKKSIPLTKLVEEFFAALKNFNFLEKTEDFINQLEEEGLLKEVEIVEQSYGAIIDIVDQMVETFGQERINLKTFSELLEGGFKQKHIGAIPQGQNQILLSTLEEGISGEYQWIFMLGANNEYLPKAKKPQAILSEQELKEISGENFGLSTRKNLDLEEVHNIHKTLLMAQTFVVFSYSKQGKNGRKQKASQYIERMKAEPMNVNRAWEFRLDPMLYELSNIVCSYMEYEKISDEDLLLLTKLKKSKPTVTLSKAIFEENPLDKEDFKIDEAKARLLYPKPLELSVTRIHQMSRCEFSHFIKYGIAPKERDISSIEPRELGSLLHNFVEDFSKEIKNNPEVLGITQEDELQSLVDRLYENKVNELLEVEILDSHRNIYLLGKIKRSANTLAKLMIEQIKSSEFSLYGQEIYFGKKGDIPEVNLENPNYEAWIKGQIDRVDIFEYEGKKYIKIVDYKSSGKVFSLSDNYNAIDVQLITYMAAAINGINNSAPGGAFYFPLLEKQLSVDDDEMEKIEQKRKESYQMDGIAITNEKILEKMDESFGTKESTMKFRGKEDLGNKDNLLSEKEFVGLINHVKHEITKKVDRLFEGDIAINPYIKNNMDTGCKYCNYRAICGIDTRVNKERLRKLAEYSVDSIKKKIGGEE